MQDLIPWSTLIQPRVILSMSKSSTALSISITIQSGLAYLFLFNSTSADLTRKHKSQNRQISTSISNVLFIYTTENWLQSKYLHNDCVTISDFHVRGKKSVRSPCFGHKKTEKYLLMRDMIPCSTLFQPRVKWRFFFWAKPRCSV